MRVGSPVVCMSIVVIGVDEEFRGVRTSILVFLLLSKFD